MGRILGQLLTSHNEKDGDVGLGLAVVEVHTAYDNHTDGNDDGDAAGDGAANGAKQQQNNFHYKVNDISGCLVCVPDPSKQRVVGRRFS